MKPIKRLSVLFSAAVLASMIGCAPTATREGTAEYVDDALITTKVKTAILRESTLSVAEINVETFKGTVQLSGFVKDPGDIAKAGQVTRTVGGVTSVKNDIRVK